MADAPHVHTLLDETDTAIRARQHASIFAGLFLLALSRALVENSSTSGFSIIAIGVAMMLFVLGATSDQQWELEYQSHRIRYRNNPLRGERLFIDDRVAARGKFGYRTEMRATLPNSGETLVVQSEAGLLRFRCHIFVESASSASTASMSDDELLAEVERRRLDTDR
jgi:hypothetical protein